MWVELELDIIVVMPRRDLLSFLTFGLSVIYIYFCIEKCGSQTLLLLIQKLTMKN
jgi:hypothetical protein